jgi:hypothetical protein
MNYLSTELQTEYLPNFIGINVHNARISYSNWGEHGVDFNYYKDPSDPFNQLFQEDLHKPFAGGTEFTSKKEALRFINSVNQ